MVLIMGFIACGPPKVEEPPTSALEIMEAYGAKEDRSVTLRASWRAPDEGSIEFSEVQLSLSPAGDPMVQKLETLLAETGLAWQNGQAQWPRLARSAPPDAMPMISRLQMAFLMLYGPPEFVVHKPIVNLGSAPVSFGVTKVERRAGRVTMTTLALVTTATGSEIAWAQASGSSTDSGLTLEGMRRIGADKPERIVTKIRLLTLDSKGALPSRS